MFVLADIYVMRKTLIILLFLSAWQLSASTVIINSIYDTEKNPESGSVIIAVENGLMDSLFDYGFIIFSTINSKSYIVDGAQDAQFMISIEMLKDSGVSFILLSSVDGEIIDSGIINLSDIKRNSEPEREKNYYLLGMEVAEQLVQFF